MAMSDVITSDGRRQAVFMVVYWFIGFRVDVAAGEPQEQGRSRQF
jgi:hypothetical protein